MASPSPEQQSAARQMKQAKLNKSAKPGKIDRHGASLARRAALTHRTAVQKINQLIAQLRFARWNLTSGQVQEARSEIVLHLKKLTALLKQLADSIFSPLALGGGGGGSPSGRTYSGSDPPTNSISNFSATVSMRTNNTIEKMVGFGKKALTGAALVVAMALPMTGESSLIRDVEFNQNGGGSLATFYLQNNDNGVTYDSAQLKFDELLDGVAESVKANNSLYTSKTLDEIKGEWNFGLDPSAGDIYTGWNTALNGSVLDFTNEGGKTLDIWSDLLNNNEAALTVDFKDQLDFNHNGSYDSLTEKLTWDGPNVTDAFKGYNSGGAGFSSDANALSVVPEPVTVGLMGLGGLLTLAARRLGDYGRTS